MHEYTKYFKEQKGFDRFINLLYKKYQSLSKFSGTISLKNISNEESISLSKFFGVNYYEGENITISIQKFLSIMQNSKYQDFNISIFVSEYLQVPLITNKEKSIEKLTEEDKFYESIIGAKGTPGSLWLKNAIISKNATYQILRKRYKKNREELQKELINIINLINNLPKKKVFLSIYSSNYTKDPHYLDIDNNHSNLFFHALSYITKSPFPITREEKIYLLAKNNIEIDSLSNFVITYHLLFDKSYLNKFTQNNESLILNIQNILNINSLNTESKKVYIFENPSILSEIILRNINASVIISGGFPNTSVYLLLDKLVKSNNLLYYNGDLDPEGLLIADKLKSRYGDKLILFCYSKNDYYHSISKKNISNKRMSKLSKLKDKDLLCIKELILLNKKPAYQESNKEEIINFIINNK